MARYILEARRTINMQLARACSVAATEAVITTTRAEARPALRAENIGVNVHYIPNSMVELLCRTRIHERQLARAPRPNMKD